MGAPSDFVRFMSFVEISEIPGSCWIWKGAKYSGYGHFHQKKAYIAHRWIYRFLSLPLEDGQILRHVCDNPSCVNPDHLVPGTHQDNMNDMMARGRGENRKGENNPKARLTPEDVVKIRGLAKGGTRYADLATLYKVSWSQIARITRREAWSHLP